MQSDAAGIPADSPIMKRLEMSHHTGAQLIALLFQTTELMKALRQPKLAQAMYRQVPVFQASRCHGNGMLTRTKPVKANIEKT